MALADAVLELLRNGTRRAAPRRRGGRATVLEQFTIEHRDEARRLDGSFAWDATPSRRPR